MISEKYRTLISNTGTEKIYFLFFSSIIVVFFEMLGIGSVPIFAYIIIDPDLFLKTLSEKFNISINLEIEKKNSWGKNELKNLITETLLQVVMKTLK